MAIVSGKVVHPGDVVTFGKYIIQQGEILKVEGIQLHIQALTERGFIGNLLGEDRTTVRMHDCWLDDNLELTPVVLTTLELNNVKRYLRKLFNGCTLRLDKSRTILSVTIDTILSFDELIKLVKHKNIKSIRTVIGYTFTCDFL